jgi:hypothetical protein
MKILTIDVGMRLKEGGSRPLFCIFVISAIFNQLPYLGVIITKIRTMSIRS